MTEEIIYSYPGTVVDAMPFALTLSGTVHCDGAYRHDRKTYPYYIFEYILDGHGTLEINSVSYRPEKDDIYIVQQGLPHKYYSDAKDPWHKIWFTATGPLINQLMTVYKLQNIFCTKGFGLRHHFEEMQGLLKNRNPELQRKSTLIFHALMYDLYTITSSFKQGQSHSALQIKDFIDNNLENRITIHDIGEAVFKSPSQVIRIFKKNYGTTPYNYLLNSRINTAKLFLQSSNLTVRQIAQRLRFSDEHYFSYIFKEKTGATPSEFRDMPSMNSAPLFVENNDW